MATFKYYEDSGKWQSIVRKKGYPTQYKMHLTKYDAEKWATLIESEMIRSVFVDNKEANITTLTDALVRYEAVAKQNKGYEVERYRIDAWKSGKLSMRAISTLKSKDFDEYRDQRRADGVSDATIRNDLAIIAAVFKHFDYGMSNPTIRTVKTLNTAEKRNRRLTALEEKYLMAQLENTRCSDPKRANKWIPIVTRFAIETASRLSEIVGKDKTKSEPAVPGLIWENVNIDKAICKLIDTKNGKSRFVPLSPAAIVCLTQASELKTVLRGPVFHTTTSANKQAWQRAKKRAQAQYKKDGGIDPDFLVDFRFHDNRHEAASRWARDFDLTKLQLITGHKDARSLLRYVNPDEDDVSLIAVKMAEVQKAKAAKSAEVQKP
jgi:integrase